MDASPRSEKSKHIVEVLIEERAEKMASSPLWPLYRAVLYPLLKQPAAVRMADAIADLSGRAVMEYVSDVLRLDTHAEGLAQVPENGRVLIASTHPTGIADGVAMYDILKARRPDLIFFANRDAIRVSPGLADVVIPVEWVEEKRTRARSRETLVAARKAFEEERCVVLFPSGRLAAMGPGKVLQEQEWLNSVAIFARKYDCPIAPAHMTGRNSWLYYLFWRLSTELRDITLFNELLNKKGAAFRAVFGPLIPPEQLKGDVNAVAETLRRHAVEDVVAGRAWRPVE